MGLTFTVPTGQWTEVAGIWVYVTPDPLAGTGTVLVLVHLAPLAVRTKGVCAGVAFQTYPPDIHDFADIDGDPL